MLFHVHRLHSLELDAKMITKDELGTWKERVKKNLKVVCRHSSGKATETRKTTVAITGSSDEIRSWYLPNANLEFYLCTNLLDATRMYLLLINSIILMCSVKLYMIKLQHC
jgi:hypothetical protein